MQPGSPNADPILDQKMPFSTPVVFRPDPALKSLTVFRPGLKAEDISSFLRLERKQKISPKALRIRIFDDYVHTFLYFTPNHTRLQTKMGKVYTRFQTKKAQKPYPLGRHISKWLV